MNCPDCNKSYETEAAFCADCGKPLMQEQARARARSGRSYLIMLVLLPVIVLVAGIGYYKFFLPEGIAAVVNGEEIKLSELDAASRIGAGADAPSDRVRYQVLNQMIAERIILQEAHKAGISITKQEIAAAVDDARKASGLEETAFRQEVGAQYGSVAVFEKSVEKSLTINKFFAEKVVPPGADQQTARIAMNQWFNSVSDKAAVRIALAGQSGGAGCGGCNKPGGQMQQGTGPGCGNCRNGAGTGKPGCAMQNASKKDRSSLSAEAQAAQDQAIEYWKERHGTEGITAKTTDYGCHLQIDIIQNGKTIGSLRYQQGTVTEL